MLKGLGFYVSLKWQLILFTPVNNYTLVGGGGGRVIIHVDRGGGGGKFAMPSVFWLFFFPLPFWNLSPLDVLSVFFVPLPIRRCGIISIPSNLIWICLCRPADRFMRPVSHNFEKFVNVPCDFFRDV